MNSAEQSVEILSVVARLSWLYYTIIHPWLVFALIYWLQNQTPISTTCLAQFNHCGISNLLIALIGQALNLVFSYYGWLSIKNVCCLSHRSSEYIHHWFYHLFYNLLMIKIASLLAYFILNLANSAKFQDYSPILIGTGAFMFYEFVILMGLAMIQLVSQMLAKLYAQLRDWLMVKQFHRKVSSQSDSLLEAV